MEPLRDYSNISLKDILIDEYLFFKKYKIQWPIYRFLRKIGMFFDRKADKAYSRYIKTGAVMDKRDLEYPLIEENENDESGKNSC